MTARCVFIFYGCVTLAEHLVRGDLLNPRGTMLRPGDSTTTPAGIAAAGKTSDIVQDGSGRRLFAVNGRVASRAVDAGLRLPASGHQGHGEAPGCNCGCAETSRCRCAQGQRGSGARQAQGLPVAGGWSLSLGVDLEDMMQRRSRPIGPSACLRPQSELTPRRHATGSSPNNWRYSRSASPRDRGRQLPCVDGSDWPCRDSGDAAGGNGAAAVHAPEFD